MQNKFRFLWLLICLSSALQANAPECDQCQAPNEQCQVLVINEDTTCACAHQIELLYWRALETGFNHSCSSAVKANKWDLGYRIGIDYHAFCYWHVNLNWAHFDANSHRHHNEDSAHWKLRYNVVNALIGRDLRFNSCFILTPFAGLQAAYIRQNLDSLSFEGECCTSDIAALLDQKDKEKFIGIGPELGIKGEWFLGCGFSCFGSVDAAILYGHFNGRSHILGNEFFCECHEKHHDAACQTVADAAIGLKWEQCICYNMLLSFQLSLEHHQYFNHNHITDTGDLCLDGGAFAIGLRF